MNAERTITNVGAGQVTSNSTDAINGSQLFATNSAVNNNSNSINSINVLAQNSVQYDNSTHNSITLGGTTYNSSTHTGGTKIINVADGSNAGDAVNYSQLTNVSNSVNNIYTTGTKYFHANSTGADSQATRPQSA
ncbi:hemaglutinin/autotransporter like protein [Caballeronia glebae]|uniref:Hemaglutinin/autotransporter like protein n=1 Tax=Caballeronia glebae TaxID=1777143 RepID=A0A158AGR7_9BURK|nr:hypothetical protein [Caballeronia glebae]SAK57061.1 hemaglutinin/autotransporter like protein [Caballeronia glebae]